MAERAPAFQFYPADFLADENVAAMTLEERGAYITLICHCWTEGSIPSDGKRVARLLHIPSKRLALLWHTLSTCFTEAPENGRLVQPRVERERDKQRERRERNIQAGQMGGRQKAKQTLSKRLANGVAKPSSSSSSSSSPSGSSVAKATAAAAPKDEPDWKADAAQTLRAAYVPEKKIGDCLKNWWGLARTRGFHDDEIKAVVLAHGKRLCQPWNPAALWNVHNEEFSRQFRWHVDQQRKKRPSLTRVADVLQGAS